MAVGLKEPENLLPVKGIRLASIAAGIKKKANASDLVLMEITETAKCSAVFTQNLFCAAPVNLCKKHLAVKTPRYLLINAGNANAGTGEQGLKDANYCCELVAAQAHCEADEVLPFSTGVIGQNLPLEKFERGIPQLFNELKEDAWMEAARGIMTTDTLLKGISRQLNIDGQTVTITGIAKGSGMIHPNMATMLGYVATDANVSVVQLQQILDHAVARSFNAITVDGDTSTNDSCVLIATAKAGNKEINQNHPQLAEFQAAITEVLEYLAVAIIRDGEGATKLITLDVINANSVEDARQVAFTIAHSPLVKTALFASDPNWGRILAAVGRAGVGMALDAIEIYLDNVCIVRNGGRAASYTEEQGQKVMSQDEITIRVDLKSGACKARVWTCDFSYDYVKINAEYRT
ncbi:MAG: bifunctional glutamate N-acetyltransferase/amino-acid acetyltransferase ArgJ [Gammaproteobacteria bacterium]|nr:MAG: bifunctional glutamate N-acetyltransferase/amino-acid acetyltransferase ArgJ [Gammaproteobacteria bacterium]